MSTVHPFETDLDRNPANYVPLSPVSFLTRAASAFADKVAVIDGERRTTYRQLLERCTRLASVLSKLGVGRLDTVAIIAASSSVDVSFVMALQTIRFVIVLFAGPPLAKLIAQRVG